MIDYKACITNLLEELPAHDIRKSADVELMLAAIF